MTAEQIKDEIRKLSRSDKIEIYRWIDEQTASLFPRIGSRRSVAIRKEIEQKCERRVEEAEFRSPDFQRTKMEQGFPPKAVAGRS